MLGWLALHAALAAAGAWLARRYALQRNLLDHPGERRSHAVSTPRGGGVGLVVALLVATLALALRDPSQRLLLVSLAGGMSLVATVGWMDDHRPLSPWMRLAVQVLASAIFAVAVLSTTGQPWAALLSFMATLVLANIWNFMDGINGIAASQALLLGIAVALATQGSWMWLGLALAAACVGFLPFNFPRARIFMGDVGSGALGFVVGAMVALAVAGRPDLGPGMLLPLSAFLVDAGLTLARRVLHRERWWLPHSQHAYQAWARRSGHALVTTFYLGWTALGIIMMLVTTHLPTRFVWAGVMAWYVLAAVVWLGLQRTGPASASTEGNKNG